MTSRAFDGVGSAGNSLCSLSWGFRFQISQGDLDEIHSFHSVRTRPDMKLNTGGIFALLLFVDRAWPPRAAVILHIWSNPFPHGFDAGDVVCDVAISLPVNASWGREGGHFGRVKKVRGCVYVLVRIAADRIAGIEE